MKYYQKKGTVKKVGCLKIIHEKYKKIDEREKFKNQFEYAVSANSEISPHISKAHEVFFFFFRIS